MEQANRMQAYMMENPEEFAKLMAYTQTGLPEAQAEAATEAEREEALRAELKGLQARYEAELERVLGPLHAKYKSLGISESGTPPAVWAEGLAIMKQMNAAYEKACPGWWGASGQFDGWLQKYKAHLVQNRIPHREGGEAMKATQFKIMGIPAETFKPTVALEAVALYLKEARDIFDSRKTQPLTEGLIQ
jgi:hypothetical protein